MTELEKVRWPHGVGTTGATPLVGTEILIVTPANLKHYIGKSGILQRDKVI